MLGLFTNDTLSSKQAKPDVSAAYVVSFSLFATRLCHTHGPLFTLPNTPKNDPPRHTNWIEWNPGIMLCEEREYAADITCLSHCFPPRPLLFSPTRSLPSMKISRLECRFFVCFRGAYLFTSAKPFGGGQSAPSIHSTFGMPHTHALRLRTLPWWRETH